jgi:hypothetical protein
MICISKNIIKFDKGNRGNFKIINFPVPLKTMKNSNQMIRYPLLVFFTVLCLDLSGQDNSIQKEILNYSNTESEIILKGRRLLLERFLEGDYEKVREIKDYLISAIPAEDYIIFYPPEYWLILHWTREYDYLLESINSTRPANMPENQRKIKPQYDLLFEKMVDKSRQSRSIIEAGIINSDIGTIEKDFLLMHLIYIIAGENNYEATRDTLNSLSDNFLTEYPGNAYEDFTRKYLRNKFVPSKWAFAFELFSGYGVFTQNLETRYLNNVPLGIAFDIEYRNLTLYLRNYIGFSRTKNDYYFDNGIWPERSQVRVFLPEASLGFIAINSNFLKIAPFAGVSSADIGPTEFDRKRDPNLEKVELAFTTTYTFGINADIKLGKSRMPLVSPYAEQNYRFIRLRYGYNLPQFERKYSGMNGQMHYLTLGIGGIGRKIKREY